MGVEVRARRFIISALLPYFFMLLLGVGFLVVTVVAGGLQALGKHSVHLFGSSWSLDPVSLALLYLIVFGSLLTLSCYLWLLRVARTSLVSTYAHVNPVVAVLLGWLVLHEPITGQILVAAAVILASVALIVSAAGAARDGSSGEDRRTKAEAEIGFEG